MKIKNIFVLGLVATGLMSCGGGGSGSSQTTETTVEEIKMVIEEIFGADGNLWKPAGDPNGSGAGNLVVLLTSRYDTKFDSCEVPLNDGTSAPLICIDDQPWTHVPYSCFSNGGRQTWRANFKCSSAARVEVVCRDQDKEVIFNAPSEVLGNVCSRFG